MRSPGSAPPPPAAATPVGTRARRAAPRPGCPGSAERPAAGWPRGRSCPAERPGRNHRSLCRVPRLWQPQGDAGAGTASPVRGLSRPFPLLLAPRGGRGPEASPPREPTRGSGGRRGSGAVTYRSGRAAEGATHARLLCGAARRTRGAARWALVGTRPAPPAPRGVSGRVTGPQLGEGPGGPASPPCALGARGRALGPRQARGVRALTTAPPTLVPCAPRWPRPLGGRSRPTAGRGREIPPAAGHVTGASPGLPHPAPRAPRPAPSPALPERAQPGAAAGGLGRGQRPGEGRGRSGVVRDSDLPWGHPASLAPRAGAGRPSRGCWTAAKARGPRARVAKQRAPPPRRPRADAVPHPRPRGTLATPSAEVVAVLSRPHPFGNCGL
jgi:hypothetical protein